MVNLSRREFLGGSAALGAALALGLEGRVNRAHAQQQVANYARRYDLGNETPYDAPEVISRLTDQSRGEVLGNFAGLKSIGPHSVIGSVGDTVYRNDTDTLQGRFAEDLKAIIGTTPYKTRTIKIGNEDVGIVFDGMSNLHRVNIRTRAYEGNLTSAFKQFFGYNPTDLISFKFVHPDFPSPPSFGDNFFLMETPDGTLDLHYWWDAWNGNPQPLIKNFNINSLTVPPSNLSPAYDFGVASLDGALSDSIYSLHHGTKGKIANSDTAQRIMYHNPLGIKFKPPYPIYTDQSVDNRLTRNAMKYWYERTGIPFVEVDNVGRRAIVSVNTSGAAGAGARTGNDSVDDDGRVSLAHIWLASTVGEYNFANEVMVRHEFGHLLGMPGHNNSTPNLMNSPFQSNSEVLPGDIEFYRAIHSKRPFGLDINWIMDDGSWRTKSYTPGTSAKLDTLLSSMPKKTLLARNPSPAIYSLLT